jgi:hypothetical protein
MKKNNSEKTDALRAEYKRSDFGPLVRGKYANRTIQETNIIVLEPDIAEAFPNDTAVNNALRGLLDLAKTSSRTAKISGGSDRKRRAG